MNGGERDPAGESTARHAAGGRGLIRLSPSRTAREVNSARIIRTDMTGRAMALEQLGENGEPIVALQLALDMDRQTFPAVLVDDSKHAECLPVMRAPGDQVIAPDMAAILGPKPDARAGIQPQPAALRLVSGYFRPLALEDAEDNGLAISSACP